MLDIILKNSTTIAAVISAIVSTISVIIASKALKVTRKSIEDANRPYIVIYRDYIQVTSTIIEYLVVKNFGKTGATIESLTFDSQYLNARDKQIFKHLKNTFIAPGQSINTVVATNPSSNGREGITVATIKYRDNIRSYTEKINLNDELLKDLNFTKTIPPSSETIEKVISKASIEFLRRNL